MGSYQSDRHATLRSVAQTTQLTAVRNAERPVTSKANGLTALSNRSSCIMQPEYIAAVTKNLSTSFHGELDDLIGVAAAVRGLLHCGSRYRVEKGGRKQVLARCWAILLLQHSPRL